MSRNCAFPAVSLWLLYYVFSLYLVSNATTKMEQSVGSSAITLTGALLWRSGEYVTIRICPLIMNINIYLSIFPFKEF